MNARRRQLAQTPSDYLEWIWKERGDGGSTFIEWLRSDAAMYWITGKPGSGKSTLVKYIAEHEDLPLLLSRPHARNWLILHFYFDFRAASTTSNNLEGCLRTLLHQLCVEAPVAEKSIRRGRNGQKIDIQNLDLNLDQLRRLLGKVVAALQRQTYICCFLDGLDEFAGDKHDVIRLAKFLQASKISRICVASRTEHLLANYFEQFPTLRMQDHNGPTTNAFVSHTLQQVPCTVMSVNLLQELVDTITTR